MNAEKFYQDDGMVTITAASVGVSCQRWIGVPESEISTTNYQQIMENRRFDVLPIIPKAGETVEYFKTDVSNQYANISRHSITDNDKVPLDTNISDIIHKMVAEERMFYFLTYNNEVTGLITEANLNCRQVQVFLFSKICAIERTLARLVNYHMSNEELEELLETKASGSDKFKIILYNYRQLIKLDLENNITEHLYLIDFFNIICKKELYQQLGFRRSQWKDFDDLNVLRNLIAHPTCSLLDASNNMEVLSRRLNKIDELTTALESWKRRVAGIQNLPLGILDQ